MDIQWWYLIFGFAVGTFFGLVMMALIASKRVTQANTAADRAEGKHRPVAAAVAKKERRLLAPPPMIGEYTLRDWLIHYHRQDKVWDAVVRDFYTAAAAEDNIKRYFGEVITQGRFDQLQRHFLGALIIVTDVGLYEDVANRLGEQHRNLMIEPEDFDQTTQILVQTLQKYGVPIDDVLPALRKIVAELRSRFVRGGVFAE